jgi:hypothetical protein
LTPAGYTNAVGSLALAGSAKGELWLKRDGVTVLPCDLGGVDPNRGSTGTKLGSTLGLEESRQRKRLPRGTMSASSTGGLRPLPDRATTL